MKLSILAQITPRTGKDYALFFAVSDYENDKLTDLSNTIKNVNDIAKVLEEQYGFDIKVVPNPTMDQIEQELKSYQNRFASRRLPKDGQLLVFFAGHGKSENKNGYFLPADADPNRLYRTAMAYDIWRPIISKINCQHILVAIDACYSVTFDPDWQNRGDETRFGRIGELSEEALLLSDHKKYTSRLFFTSDAAEDVVPGRSNFARKLLEGLLSQRGKGGYLTAEELFAVHVNKAQPSPKSGDFEGDHPQGNFLFFSTFEAPKVDANRYNQRQRDINAYTAIKNNPTIRNCQQYLVDFPHGEFLQEVSQQLQQLQDEQEWQYASLKGTKVAYQNYLQLHPKGRHAKEARQRTNAPIATTPTVKPPDQMVFVQGGTFEMGDVFGAGESDEKPIHNVTLNSYYMGRYEVVNEDFVAFLNSVKTVVSGEEVKLSDNLIYDLLCSGCDNWEDRILYSNNKFSIKAGYEKHPVALVTWYGVANYCNWLSEEHGLQKVYTIIGSTVTANWSANGYRLPTEAEWEYAARSRGKKEKWAGTSEESKLLSYANGGGDKDGHKKTSPVGSFRANDLGLYDMSGNVYEWCWDWFEKYSAKAKTDPRGPSSGSYRVLRGGSWYSIPAYLRCAYRNFITPDIRFSYVGVRLSRAAR